MATTATATATVGKEQTATNGAGDQVTRHSEVGHKSLLRSDDLYQYILETTVYPREHECMKQLREDTANHPWYYVSLPLFTNLGSASSTYLLRGRKLTLLFFWQEPDDHVGGRGPVPQPAAQAHRRQEDHGDRRLHRLLPPRHRARHPRRRNHPGHGHQPRQLRDHRAAVHREGRRGAQDRLPRGPRAARPRRAAGGRGQPRHLRLRLRRRRQGQLPQLPPAPHEARQGRRAARLRQHALERIRRAPRRRAHAQVHPLLPRLRPRAQQGPRRRRPRRDLPAPRRRRNHTLPPRQVNGRPPISHRPYPCC